MTRVKICGVTRPGDAQAAADLGAWAVGLNFWPGSPRRCEPGVAAEIGAALKRRCEVAGVFVNATLDEVAEAAEVAELTIVQLHGDEGPAYCAEAARRTGCKVIKALGVWGAADIRGAEMFRTDFHLFDARVPGTPGGSGVSFDWAPLADRRSQVPMILAGGINAGNAAEAIAIAHPFAVDAASGVESEPGIKEQAKMESLFEAVGAGAVREAPLVSEPLR